MSEVEFDTRESSDAPKGATAISIVVAGSMPPPQTGTTILMQQLCDELRTRDNVSVIPVDTSGIRGNGLRGIFRALRFSCSLYRAARRADVLTIHVSTTGVHIAGPIAIMVGALARRPVLLRKFAGADFSAFGRLQQALMWWVVRNVQLYLAETRQLVARTEAAGITHVRWYANSRPLPESAGFVPPRKECRRFVFVGQVREYKGIIEMVQAAERFSQDIHVDVYGPWFGDLDRGLFDGCARIAYKGELSREEIMPALAQYDAMLLPTKALTEGYPGAILESYVAGLPVIASQCGAISEIVNEQCGILIPPGDTDALHAAMRSLVDDPAYFVRLQEGACAQRTAFSSRVWADRFVALCMEVRRTKSL